MKIARLLGTALAAAALPTATASAAVQVADSGTTFTAPGTVSTQVADIDGDGHLDIITGSTATGGTVAIHLGDGDGGFTTPTGLTDQTADKADYVTVADTDGDGRKDLITTDDQGNTVHIWHQLAGSTLEFETVPTTVRDRFFDVYRWVYPAEARNLVRDVLVQDMTGDGTADLVISGEEGVAVAPRVGGAYPSTSQFSRADHPGFIGLSLIDLDADGAADLVGPAPNGDAWRLMSSLHADTDGSYITSADRAGHPRDMVTADLDDDGDQDMIIGDGGATTAPVTVLVNDGTVSPSGPSVSFPTATSVSDLTMADLTGDGRADVVAATSAGPYVIPATGDANGPLGSPFALGTGLSGDQVAVGDLDEDGLPDLVSASTSGVEVRLNTTSVAATVAADAPFGGTLLGEHTDRTVTLTNTGSVALTPGTPTITGLDASQVTVTSSTCAVAVPAGHSCTVGLRYAPIINGALSATLTFPSAAPTPDTALSLSLSGTGQVGGFLDGPGIEDAGQVALGATATRTLTYTNTGDRPLTLPAAFFEGTGDWTITSDACTGSLAAGATCTVTVAVTPTTLGAQHAVLVVGGLSTSLEATGIAAPVTGDREPTPVTPEPVTPAPATPSPAPVSTPAPTTTPAVTKPRIAYRGVLRRGVRLTASATATGTPTPTLTYRWQRCTGSRCVVVGTGRSYAVAAADRGKRLEVKVTATNSAGTAKAISARTATVRAR